MQAVFVFSPSCPFSRTRIVVGLASPISLSCGRFKMQRTTTTKRHRPRPVRLQQMCRVRTSARRPEPTGLFQKSISSRHCSGVAMPYSFHVNVKMAAMMPRKRKEWIGQNSFPARSTFAARVQRLEVEHFVVFYAYKLPKRNNLVLMRLMSFTPL